jgi:hypothetical protein
VRELLIAMITLEAAFGITGLIAAPIYYAYIKSELADPSPVSCILESILSPVFLTPVRV